MVLLGWIMPDQYDWVGLASASPHAGSSRLGWVVPDHHDWVALWNRAVAYGKVLCAPQNTVTSQQLSLRSARREKGRHGTSRGWHHNKGDKSLTKLASEYRLLL